MITRFPPEPNGYLHIGHCKSIFVNFNDTNMCHVRFDDTNPSAEKQEYVDNAIYDLKWLNVNIDEKTITYTSDYFNVLYDYAILLIKNNYAYVDFTLKDQLRTERHAGIENEYRNKSIEYSLESFENMKNGKYKQNECVLRLKIDMKNNNHVLRDPIAYRINYDPHYRTNDKWVIYPSYDYSHGIIDALEGITHSYCTTEFYIRRDLYYWTPNKLIELGVGLVVAEEIEYGKLTIENNILSKRNINKLIVENKVNGYDDPRLFTICGLRRRGFTPTMIKKIIDTSSVDNKKDTMITTDFIEHVLRTELNDITFRAFATIDVLKVKIIDFDKIEKINCVHPNHPNNKDFGFHEKQLSEDLYIEKNDFMQVHNKNYYRFTPENKVRLKYHEFFEYVNYDKDILYIKECQVQNPKKVKGCIHWVNDTGIKAKFELFSELAPDNIYDEKSIMRYDGFVEKYCMDSEIKIWHFERLGYFKLDRFENNIPVFILIAKLFEKTNNKF